MTSDLNNYIYIRSNGYNLSQEFLEQHNLTNPGEQHPFTQKLKSYNKFPIFENPLIFSTEQEFMDHITSEKYENFDDLKVEVPDDEHGICFAVMIQDNLSNVKESPKINVKIFLEMMDGVTPAAGRRRGTNITSQ